MIINEFFQKQIESAIQVIHMYSEEFASKFFDAEEAERLRKGDANIYATLGLNCFYVQRAWVQDGKEVVRESEIGYDEYNEWYGGLTAK